MDNKTEGLGKALIRIIFIIICILLIVNFSRKLSSGSGVSFGAFLEFLANVDTFRFDFSVFAFSIGGDWGILDVIRRVINVFGKIYGLALYLVANLWNLIFFLLQFIQFLFV